jgi:hypothetical protein
MKLLTAKFSTFGLYFLCFNSANPLASGAAQPIAIAEACVTAHLQHRYLDREIWKDAELEIIVTRNDQLPFVTVFIRRQDYIVPDGMTYGCWSDGTTGDPAILRRSTYEVETIRIRDTDWDPEDYTYEQYTEFLRTDQRFAFSQRDLRKMPMCNDESG